MAEYILNTIYRFRFLTVGFLTLILLSGPFKGTEAETTVKPLIDGDRSVAIQSNKSLQKTKIIFASEENGGVSAFELSGLDSTVKVGEKQTIDVKAVDDSGLTVTDYTGTIRFSSTDSEANVPNDYTFLAEDQGDHEFSLGFSFVTPDEQTISVADTSNPKIEGSISTNVVTSSSDLDQSVDYENTFESEDFQREGDFELDSPASGSYSSSSINVEGEGDYGYTAVIYLNDEEAARTEIDKENKFSYTIDDLDDGTYELWVEIVDVQVSEDGTEEDIKTVEKTSDTESIVIDTTPPELVSLSVKPGTSMEAGLSGTATVLSEESLDSVTMILNEVVYELKETSTSGKYQAEFTAPNESGDYTIDIVLKDSLGNEAEYRDKETITVAGDELLKTDTGSTTEETVIEIPAPTGLSSAAGREEVTLSWEAAEIPEGQTLAFYRIYYGPTKETLFASSDTYDTSTSWLITDLSGGEKYYFTVVAVDSEGNEGVQSEAIVALPLKKTSTSSEYVPSAPEPALANGEMPKNSPETGPGTNLLILLSLAGSIGYYSTLRLAKQKKF